MHLARRDGVLGTSDDSLRCILKHDVAGPVLSWDSAPFHITGAIVTVLGEKVPNVGTPRALHEGGPRKDRVVPLYPPSS